MAKNNYLKKKQNKNIPTKIISNTKTDAKIKNKTKSKTTKNLSNKNKHQKQNTVNDKKTTDSSLFLLQQLQHDIWPAERDVLFRPDRYKYVRKLIKPDNCVFCEAAQTAPSFQTLCLYQSQHSMIVLNKFPYNSGHLLVLPKNHGGDFLQLSKPQFDDLHQTLKLAFRLVTLAYDPAGVNLGMNHGAIAGAGIPDHLHYHLIPRWSGDLNFFPLIAETKAVIEGLDGTYERLKTVLNKI